MQYTIVEMISKLKNMTKLKAKGPFHQLIYVINID
jgi:hypothetical protein